MRSQYDPNLNYSDDTCVVTFLVKKSTISGHVVLIFEGKDIAQHNDQSENILAFDFMQKEQAETLATAATENRENILNNFPNVGISTQVISDVRENRIPFSNFLLLLTQIINESIELQEMLKRALVYSSKTAIGSATSLFAFDVGIIRSSHPQMIDLESKKIRAWEALSTIGDTSFSFQVPKQELDELIRKIRQEETQGNRPFQYFGKQSKLFNGVNCLDWAIEKLMLIAPIRQHVENAWNNSGKLIATPYSFCEALKVEMQNKDKNLLCNSKQHVS